MGSLVDRAYSQISVDTVVESETILDKNLKQTISTWACIAGKKDCLERTKNALTKEAVENVMVHPDIAGVVYCYGMRNAGETEFVHLYRRIYPTQNWAFRTMIIDALGCSQNKEFLKDLLQTVVAPNGAGVEINYKSSERTRIVQSIYSGGRAGCDALIEFLMDRNMVDEFTAFLGINTLNSVVSNIAARTNNQEELAKVSSVYGVSEMFK